MKRHHFILLLAVISLVFCFSTSAQDVSDNNTCLECHGEKDMTGELDGVETSMYIDPERFDASIHSGLSCVDCHSSVEELPHDDPLPKVDCSSCHEANEKLVTSVHKDEKGPKCLDCHGEPHGILPADNRDSRTNHFNIANTCGKCHSDPAIMSEYKTDIFQREALFQESVHAKELAAGNEKAPSCIQCHGAHDIKPLRDPESRTNFMNVPKTCGQCHKVESEQYLQSIHGESAMYGHKDAPICTDCHGEHAIYRTNDPRSPVSFFNVAGNTCARCHSSIVINEKYNIATQKVTNYFESYHGLAMKGGSTKAANCASCHGNHLILPPSDPRSTVSPERLVETCGKCHEGISANVLAAPIHSVVTLRSSSIVAWVPRIYIPLIILVIGGMLLHNGVILWALLKEKFRQEKGMKSYRRFTNFEIFCHVVLTFTFIMLSITGFALLSPNSWWVTGLSYIGFTESVRGTIHRINGVGLIIVSFMYGVYMLCTRRGRSEVIAFMPRPRDLTHVYQHLAFYLGKRNEPPKFDRYDYTEKMEFWALIWGVIIMAVTGLILWFPILSFEYMPKWLIDIAERIHYYEAILATLAIVVWHFFFVIFHPEEYPMSVTWLNGRMTLHHLKNRHPLEFERLNDQDIIEDNSATSDEEPR
ncbi:MAG: hypothetical protein GC154_06785 [bacterium]|nr:hypothetical protein [bacterium]